MLSRQTRLWPTLGTVHPPMHWQTSCRFNKTRASSLTLADLSEDIVRVAFELAADDIHVGLECALVSKQVQGWCVRASGVGLPKWHLI
jgi:hypothetical protein